jgi:MATE family, multidrug efflux pump
VSSEPRHSPDRIVTDGVWTLAWPTMASMGAGTVVRFTDFAMVGSLGPAALAGVGIGGQFSWLLEAIAMVAPSGLAAILARAVGRGDWDLANASFRQAQLLGALLSLIGCALLIPFTTQAITLFGVEEDVIRFGSDYLWWRIWGTLPLSMAIVFGTALRAAGDVRTPLWVSVIAAAANVFLNWVLIFGNLGFPAMGVVGAAIASNLAIALMVAIFAGLWMSDRLAVKPGYGSWRPDRSLFGRLLRIGTPAGLETGIFQIGLLAFQRIMSPFGTDAIAAYNVGATILSFSFIPGVGFSTAAATLVGQRLGAGTPDAAAKDGWRSNSGCVLAMSGFGLLLILGARQIAGIFTTDPSVIELTIDVIWILGAAHPFMAVEFALGGALRGAGDTLFPMLTVFTGLLCLRLGLAFSLATFFGASIQVVWCALIVDYFVKSLMFIGRFRRGAWRRVEV